MLAVALLAKAALSAAGDRAEWTMMVYAVADTDTIGAEMTRDLAELAVLSQPTRSTDR